MLFLLSRLNIEACYATKVILPHECFCFHLKIRPTFSSSRTVQPLKAGVTQSTRGTYDMQAPSGALVRNGEEQAICKSACHRGGVGAQCHTRLLSQAGKKCLLKEERGRRKEKEQERWERGMRMKGWPMQGVQIVSYAERTETHTHQWTAHWAYGVARPSLDALIQSTWKKNETHFTWPQGLL